MKTLLTVVAAALAVNAAGREAAARVEAVQVRAVNPAAFLGPSDRAYYVATDATEAEAIAAQHALIRAGARNVNLILPDRIITCLLPRDGDPARLAAPDGFVRLDATGATRSAASWVEACHARVDRALAEPPRAGTPGGAAADRIDDRVFIHSPEEVAAVSREIARLRAAGASPLSASPGAAAERNIQQNSEILGGHILAQFIFPESNGDLELSIEDWQETDLADAISGCYEAMLHWEGRFPTLDIHSTIRLMRATPTRYEPIQHNNRDDHVWILDTMRMMGFAPAFETENVQAIMHEYNNVYRAQTGADWAFSAFIACSRNQPEHRFVGADYTAYAFLGGPYLVEPYPAGLDPNLIGEKLVFSQIVNHEAGHCFWTLDEYSGAPGRCQDRSGYLNYANFNLTETLAGLPHRCMAWVDCIMHSAAREDLFRPWCDYSQGHLGVIDNDNSGWPDVWESPPTIAFAVLGPETVQINHATIRFTANSTAVPNRNPYQTPADRINYAAPLGGATFALGTGTQYNLSAEDGAWDEVTEDSKLELDIGSTGYVTLQFRVKNAIGYPSAPYRKDVYFLGVNLSTLRMRVGEGRIDLEWDVRGTDFGATYTVYRIGPGESMPGEPIAQNVGPVGGSGRLYRVADGNITPGRDYSYYVEAAFELPVNGVQQKYNSTTRVVSTTAMIPVSNVGMVSHVSPNPGRDNMTFSIIVPKTFVEQTAPGGVTLYQQRVATRVEVRVFDVGGRRVRQIYEGGEFRDVLTLHWDGLGDDGRRLPTGVYFIRVLAGTEHATRKVLLLH